MSNVQKLKKAGFTIPTGTPKAYQNVINDLSDAEIALLIGASALLNSVNDRLNQAQRADPELKSYKQFLAPPPL